MKDILEEFLTLNHVALEVMVTCDVVIYRGTKENRGSAHPASVISVTDSKVNNNISHK